MISPKNIAQVVIVIVITALIVYLIVSLLGPHLKTAKYVLFGPNLDKISEERKAEIQTQAEKLRDNIYSWVFYVTPTQLAEINLLPDNELAYFNQYYNEKLTDNNLAYDIDWEQLPGTDEDQKLLKRMKELGLPGKTGWTDPDNPINKSNPLGLVIAGTIGLVLIAVIATKGEALKAAL